MFEGWNLLSHVPFSKTGFCVSEQRAAAYITVISVNTVPAALRSNVDFLQTSAICIKRAVG